MGINSISGPNQGVPKSPGARDESASPGSGKKDTSVKAAAADQVASAAARAAERGDVTSNLDAGQALELAESTARDIASASIEAAVAVHGRQNPKDLLPLLSA